jgi:phosphomethylpyrimidine synthase
MTQLEYAKKNMITPLMRRIAAVEGITAKSLCSLIKQGVAVIPANAHRALKQPCAVGKGLRTKINANIGTSTDKCSLGEELKKLQTAQRYGADCVMDLSVGGDLKMIRAKILADCRIPLGTVPVYEVAVNAQEKRGDLLSFDSEDILDVLRRQAAEGVDFFTIHAGVTRRSLSKLHTKKRVLGIVSRGGAILAAWVKRNKRENPFYEHFDRILDIAYEHDVTLSLGDGLRPGSVLDATDAGQLAELRILGALAARAYERNVQVMIEGPGHVPLDQIKKNIELQKKICRGAPFYVLGPLVTDIAPGYDHITSAIGGAMAAAYGADFLCYVTPSEHLSQPSVEDVRQGVVASRIAAHAADIVKKVPGALSWDKKISQARCRRDWKKQIELSIDKERSGAYRMASKPEQSDVCTMCGKYCSIKLMEQCEKKSK